MRKITTVDYMTTRLHIPTMTTRSHTPTQVTFTTNRLIENISSKKEDIYSTQIFTKNNNNTKKFDTSTSQFTEIVPKTTIFETKTSEFTVKDERTTTNGYSHPIYQITFTPNQVIVRKIPAVIVSLASVPSAILVCLVLAYFLIKCKEIIKKRKLRSRQSRSVRDSRMIEMCSVINEQKMPSPER